MSELHQFYRYEIDIQNYEPIEVPSDIIEYNRFDKSHQRGLRKAVRDFQNEFNWSDMWKYGDARRRLLHGYHLFILRPERHRYGVNGWIWLAPDGELKNAFVREYLRGKGWCMQLNIAAINRAWDLCLEKVYVRIDDWNIASCKAYEKLLYAIGCPVKFSIVQEEYKKDEWKKQVN